MTVGIGLLVIDARTGLLVKDTPFLVTMDLLRNGLRVTGRDKRESLLPVADGFVSTNYKQNVISS